MGRQEVAVASKEQAEVVPYVPFQGRKDIGVEAKCPEKAPVSLCWCSGRACATEKVDPDSGEVMEEPGYYKGFFFDIGADEELDKVAKKAGLEQMMISHQEGPKKHWVLPKVSCFLFVQELQTFTQMKKSSERKGVAYGEKYPRDKEGKKLLDYKKTYFYIQVLPAPLLAYGRPLVLCLHSTQTEDGLEILRQAYHFLQSVHTYLESIGQDLPLPYSSYAILLTAAPKPSRRKGKKGATDIFPVIALRPKEITGEVLAQLEAPEAMLDLFKELTTKAVTWSTELVTSIVERDAREEADGSLADLVPPDEEDPFLSE
jgi:hypothetical protein